ncbi:MAG: hypothetical protein BWY67_02540 [Bacteroidetes bacterium ADurb.Bin397]|nr:MAG: hypothetical protein BWY67_02540 [Bacteroidetes bacterium ADurb.Bin397]
MHFIGEQMTKIIDLAINLCSTKIHIQEMGGLYKKRIITRCVELSEGMFNMV